MRTKPNPVASQILSAEPTSLVDQACRGYVRSLLSKLTRGRLTIVWPGGQREEFGTSKETSEDGQPSGTIIINNFRVFRRLLLGGSSGLGEAYVDGDWDTPDLAGLLGLFLDNSHVLEDRRLQKFLPTRALLKLRHFLRRNTVTNSRKNIGAHYDLSNDLFKLFLDTSMTYSCALFASPDDSLEEAQRNKVAELLKKARLTHEDHVLEVGSGWGTLALEAADKAGCRVTSITVSEQQLALASERLKASRHADKVSFRFQDYREVEGKFSKIVSVEMLEAVGHENLGKFFAMCERCLSPEGVVVLQFIASPDQWYDNYRSRVDFIQKHIFPGSHLPSLNALLKAAEAHSQLNVEQVENIGPHYARTLRDWRTRFNKSSDAVRALGYDSKFQRMWNFYFASCEALFATRWLHVYQLVLTRPNNQRLVSGDIVNRKQKAEIEAVPA